MLTFCLVRTVHVATLPCGGYVGVGWGGWGGVGVLTFCLVRTVHVATLPCGGYVGVGWGGGGVGWGC